MESKTKSRLNLDTIHSLFKLHFPDAEITSIYELTEGMCNAAWQIDCTGIPQKKDCFKSRTCTRNGNAYL